MSCLTVNTQVNRQVVNIHNDVKQDIKQEEAIANPYEPTIHYPDLSSNAKLSDVVLKIVMKSLESNNKTLTLTLDELKEVIKTICQCNEVLIECDDPNADAVSCCGASKDIVYKCNVKKILLKYNDKTCLEDFKMHYNELKIITEDYKININEVVNCIDKDLFDTNEHK